MTSEIQPRTLKDSDAAQYIGMSESWLRQSRMRGSQEAPPYIKIGRSIRYLRDDLDAWLQEHRQPEDSSRSSRDQRRSHSVLSVSPNRDA